MAKIVLRLNKSEAMALYAALEYCDICFRIGKRQEKIMNELDAKLLEIEEKEK